MRTILAAALLVIASSAARAQSYQIVGTESSAPAKGLTKTVTTVQVGSNPLDRFRITRVTKDASGRSSQGAILLLPPAGGSFKNYEVGESGDYDNSAAASFARRNFDVWGYSPRAHGLAAGTCESGAADCSAMAGWGLQTVVDDVAFVRQQIALAHPGRNPVVGASASAA